jgi:hypothetical protein
MPPLYDEKGLIFFSEIDQSRVLSVLESANLAFVPLPEAIQRNLGIRWKIPGLGEPAIQLALDDEDQTQIWRWSCESIIRAAPRAIGKGQLDREKRMPLYDEMLYSGGIGHTERVYIFRSLHNHENRTHIGVAHDFPARIDRGGLLFVDKNLHPDAIHTGGQAGDFYVNPDHAPPIRHFAMQRHTGSWKDHGSQACESTRKSTEDDPMGPV